MKFKIRTGSEAQDKKEDVSSQNANGKRALKSAVAAFGLAAALAAPACNRTGMLEPPKASHDDVSKKDAGVTTDTEAPVKNDASPDLGSAPDTLPSVPDTLPPADTLVVSDTKPGSDAGNSYVVWTGSNLIGDFLDRTLGDRQALVPDSDSNYSKCAYPIGGSDTSENASPFTDGNRSDIGTNEVYMQMIGGSQVKEFTTQYVVDNDSADVYTEDQALWIKGDNHYDYTSDNVVGKLNFLAYTMKFGGPAAASTGIPVCTSDSTGAGDLTACKGSSGDLDYATDAHRVRITLLGETWIVSDMIAPEGTLTSESTLVHGGSIKLARESTAGILNVGESLSVDSIRFRLDDLETGGKSAILSILDSSDNILKKDKVAVGDTKEFNINGKSYKFHCYKVAPGYTAGAMWADVGIFSNEIELRDGQELDQDNSKNKGYTVALGWKNSQASVTSTKPDSLRTIVVYSDSIGEISSNRNEKLEVGDYVPLFKDPSAWKLMYTGLDLAPSDSVLLKFEIKRTDLVLNQVDVGLPGTSSCVIKAPYVKVSSAATEAVFSTTTPSGGSVLSDNSFLFPLAMASNCTTDGSPDVSVLAVFMKVSQSSSHWGIGSPTVSYAAIGKGSERDPSAGGTVNIELPKNGNTMGSIFSSIGAKCDNGACIDEAGTTDRKPDAYISVFESAGDGVSSAYRDFFAIAIDQSGTGNPADATFSFNSTDGNGFSLSNEGRVAYGHASENPANTFFSGPDSTGPYSSGVESVQPGYVSERGSTLESVTKDEVKLSMAHKLARAVWKLIKG